MGKGPAVSAVTHLDHLKPFLKSGAVLEIQDGLPVSPIAARDEALDANAYYFGRTEWMRDWLKFVHRYPEFRERWQAVGASWEGKVVIDIGCGPGNVLASLREKPAIAIGVDVAPGSLHLAEELGYVPLLADAHDLPLKSECADLVALNATLHHCRDMDRVLVESARLVRPGGMLVLDHDPQHSAWNYKGLGLLLWKLRKPVYRWMKRGGHRAEGNEQQWAEKTEIHHRPGDGITEEMIRRPLEAMGFDVRVYPHNHKIGAGVLQGERGQAADKLRWGQKLSGIDPDTAEGALSLMIVAVRRPNAT